MRKLLIGIAVLALLIPFAKLSWGIVGNVAGWVSNSEGENVQGIRVVISNITRGETFAP